MSLADIWLFVQQGVLSGLVTGSIYALLALSVVIIFKTTDVANFAQGEIFMTAAYIALYCVVIFATTLFVGIITSFVLTMLFCAVFQRLILRQVQKASGVAVNLVIATLGFSYFLKGVVRSTGLGDTPRSLPAVFSSESIPIGQASITQLDAAIFLIAVGVMMGLFFMFNRTRFGKALRAVGMNPRGSQLVGVNLDRMHILIWAISGLISAIAAVLIAPKILMTTDMGHVMMLGFAAAIIGGFNSLPGAVVGGFIVGILENLVGLFISTNAIVVAPFLAIMVILLLRPQGLLGGKFQVKKL
ncbi:branched-chain amino acid ABC transporter permease [Polaromonas sp. P1(28)-8]|nr:branched-chain amino acid ABC transporter permease [Polaromonas sp. P1(28)-8]